ncbi:MAG: GAF domain-containing protein [Anaerolineales bacterium]
MTEDGHLFVIPSANDQHTGAPFAELSETLRATIELLTESFPDLSQADELGRRLARLAWAPAEGDFELSPALSGLFSSRSFSLQNASDPLESYAPIYQALAGGFLSTLAETGAPVELGPLVRFFEIVDRLLWPADQLAEPDAARLGDGVLLLSPTAQIVYISKPLAVRLGYTLAQLQGKPVEVLLPERLRSVHEQARRQYLKPPVNLLLPRQGNYAGLTRTGEEIPLRASLEFFEIGPRIVTLGTISTVPTRDELETVYRAYQKRYQGLTGTQLAYVVRMDAEGRIRFANQALCQLTGKTCEQLEGRRLTEMFHPEDVPAIEQNLRALDRPPFLRSGLSRLNTPEDTHWVEWESHAIRDWEGQVLEIQLVLRDVTRFKAVEAELEQRLQEARTLAAINRALNETLELDPVLELIVASTRDLIPHAGQVVLHLYKPEKDLLLPAATAGLEGDRNATLMMSKTRGVAGLALVEKKLVNVGDTSQDPRYMPLSGEGGQPASLMVAPILNAGRVLGTISVQSPKPYAFHAGHERILSELAVSAAIALNNAQIYEKERRQRQLLEALSDSETAIHQSLDLDQVLDSILDHTLWLVPGKSANIMLLQDERAFIVRHHGYDYIPGAEQTLKNATFPLEAPFFKKMLQTGQAVWVPDVTQEPNWVEFPEAQDMQIRSYAAAPLKARDRILGFINVDSPQPHAFDEATPRRLQMVADHAASAIQNAHLHQDLLQALQEERQARENLSQAEKLATLGRMITTVIHEINNPLQSLQNCLYILEEESTVVPEAEQFFDVALSEIDRLSRVVGQLREVQKSGPQIEKTEVSLQQVLEKVRLLVARQLQQNHIKWVQDNLPEQVTVSADRDMLTQLFLNLVLNAVEAMSGQRSGKITLRVLLNTADREVGVSIADTGPGIAPQVVNDLFDPFVTTKQEGLGLGLAVCYDIVHSHGGRITLDSRQGSGTCFTVWLPQPA